MEMITGSDCTKRQPHQEELPGGTMATRRRIETGGEVNPTSTLNASGTRRTGSPTCIANTSNTTTTLARNAQVAYLRANVLSTPDLSISLLVDTNIYKMASLRSSKQPLVIDVAIGYTACCGVPKALFSVLYSSSCAPLLSVLPFPPVL